MDNEEDTGNVAIGVLLVLVATFLAPFVLAVS